MSKSPAAGAFTLVELLLAIVVLSLLIVLLMRMLNHTSGAWIGGRAQTDRRQSARVLADAIAQELQSALLPLDPSDPSNLQFTLNPSSVPAEYRHPDALFWQAPVATDRSFGDVAEIGYFLKWDESDISHPRPFLCRFFVNPTDSDNYLIYRQPTQWLSGSILDAVAPANRVNGNAYRGLFAENVVGFWVRCYDGNREIISPAEEYDSRVTKTLPRSVKIFLVLIDSASVPRLHRKPDYATAGDGDEPDLEQFVTALPDGIRQTARPFTLEVYLRNSR